jgi:hypothetical protein
MADGRFRFSELRNVQRNGKLFYASPAARILEAALAIAEADSEDDAAWHRCWVRLRKTLVEVGWTPPAAGLLPDD